MSAITTAEEPKNEQEVLGTYRQMQSEMQGLVQNLTKMEMERNEHRLVEETLTPLDPDRRAFRLVGGVLVERTVREVLPTVKEHRGNLDIFVQNLKEKLDSKQKEAAAWKAKYNIKTQEEAEAANRQ
mmetsp:Transcript_33046/g.69549  ORF Transcript_33046/g.69549 Transcript_33046/m.69549 type:complete len:127 (-) Transcript_33046:286-666(-)|eukprot:CAMPEP_0172298914 /NCGR_PEP_ID=MMETSP1058-20130122/1346_1 /TAXON_ID=83371 /ORGANISM="Detonula confervacea, Strain CCMP 353" /LENGTH=126 /DNA_ID=CAMNT_0013008209 /DNA_START=241 /DNA_END=621 /DNA_ORIENTATION=+